jgi:hypothetical protein
MQPTPEQFKQAATIIQQVAVNTDKVIADVAEIIAERDKFYWYIRNEDIDPVTLLRNTH